MVIVCFKGGGGGFVFYLKKNKTKVIVISIHFKKKLDKNQIKENLFDYHV